MFAVIDIDCSLYSWRELLGAQRLKALSLAAAKARGRRFLHEAADRVFGRSSRDIAKRLWVLEGLFSGLSDEDGAALYTSYPLTKRKREAFSSFPLPVHSSYPEKKSAGEICGLCGRSPNLVIGDRREDRELARDLGALWAGFPFYDFHHLLSGPAYTKAFSCLVTDAVSRAAEAEA